MSSSTEKFTIGCPMCGKRYVVAPSAIGRKATCKCGKSFVVARPEEDAEEDEEGDSQGYDVAQNQD